MKHDNYTPGEIAAMHDRNESFRGKTVDFNRLRVYREIEGSLLALAAENAHVISVTAEPPSPREMVSIVVLDLDRISVIPDQEKRLLARAVELADDVILSCPDGRDGTETDPCIRITFGVHGIWKK